MKDIIIKILKDEVISAGDDMYNMSVIDAADIPILANKLSSAFNQSLRKELILFLKNEQVQFTYGIEPNEIIVDEYLKSREK